MKRVIFPLVSCTFIPFVSFAEVTKVEKISIKEPAYQIEKEEIEKNKDFDLGEILFKNYPEISIVRKGVSVTEIFLRGFGRNNINVLIDDTRVYGACPNGMDNPAFFVRPFEIEGISIKTNDIQNQGSLGGVINVITKKPQPDKNEFDLNVTGGSFGYNYTSLVSNLSGFWVGFASLYSKPYETGEGKKVTEYPTGMSAYQDKYIDKKAIDLKQTTMKLKYKSLNFTASYFDAKSVLYPYLMMDSTKDENLRFGIEYNSKDNLNINLYYSQMDHDMSDTYRVSAVPWTDGTLSSRGYMMRTIASSKVYGTKIVKGFSKVDAGVELFNREWLADNQLMMIDNKGMIPDVKNFNFGIFGFYKTKLKNINVKAGIRFDHFYSKANIGVMGDNKNLYSMYYGTTKTTVNHDYISGLVEGRKNIGKNLSTRVTLSHTIRFPDPQELFIALQRPPTKPNWVGNPFLKPTKNRQIELALDKKFIKGKLNFTLFYSDLKDYIYLYKFMTPAPALSYTNIDAYMYGGSVNGFFSITDSISVSTGLSYQVGKKKEGEDKDLAEIPPLKAMLSLVYKRDNLAVYLEDIYNHDQDDIDSTLNELPTDSWNVVNLRFSYTKKSMNFTFGVENLFDEFYYLHLSYLRNPFSTGVRVPEPGRFLYVKVDVRL
ncbi:MAG: TonB-dependent receptor [Aquificae bacterium]|nr:TonB-dependent receptor [Aquificota bacterium]